jgi:hypothetical protein
MNLACQELQIFYRWALLTTKFHIFCCRKTLSNLEKSQEKTIWYCKAHSSQNFKAFYKQHTTLLITFTHSNSLGQSLKRGDLNCFSAGASRVILNERADIVGFKTQQPGQNVRVYLALLRTRCLSVTVDGSFLVCHGHSFRHHNIRRNWNCSNYLHVVFQSTT